VPCPEEANWIRLWSEVDRTNPSRCEQAHRSGCPGSIVAAARGIGVWASTCGGNPCSLAEHQRAAIAACISDKAVALSKKVHPLAKSGKSRCSLA
jgi:hypothetical protein